MALHLLMALRGADLPPLDDVVWLRQPTAAEINEVVPHTKTPYSGVFVLNCTILPGGELTACTVVVQPGDAPAPPWAIRLAAYFKVAPVSGAGLSTANRTIKIPMNFTMVD